MQMQGNMFDIVALHLLRDEGCFWSLISCSVNNKYKEKKEPFQLDLRGRFEWENDTIHADNS